MARQNPRQPSRRWPPSSTAGQFVSNSAGPHAAITGSAQTAARRATAGRAQRHPLPPVREPSPQGRPNPAPKVPGVQRHQTAVAPPVRMPPSVQGERQAAAEGGRSGATEHTGTPVLRQTMKSNNSRPTRTLQDLSTWNRITTPAARPNARTHIITAETRGLNTERGTRDRMLRPAQGLAGNIHDDERQRREWHPAAGKEEWRRSATPREYPPIPVYAKAAEVSMSEVKTIFSGPVSGKLTQRKQEEKKQALHWVRTRGCSTWARHGSKVTARHRGRPQPVRLQIHRGPPAERGLPWEWQEGLQSHNPDSISQQTNAGI